MTRIELGLLFRFTDLRYLGANPGRIDLSFLAQQQPPMLITSHDSHGISCCDKQPLGHHRRAHIGLSKPPKRIQAIVHECFAWVKITRPRAKLNYFGIRNRYITSTELRSYRISEGLGLLIVYPSRHQQLIFQIHRRRTNRGT